MRYLLSAGLLVLVTFNALGKGGTNQVIFAAAERGDVEQLQKLFAANTNLLALRDELLRAAALSGQKPSVEFLIAQGANVNAPGFFDMTPLAHMAMYSRAGDENGAAVAASLIAKGAEIDPVDQYGGTPLLHAAEAGKIRLMRVLLEHGADPAFTNHTTKFTCLQFAVRGGNLEMTRLLMDFKAPIVGTGDDWYTPLLIWVMSRQNYELTRLLLEHGATITPPQSIPGLGKNSPQYYLLENANRERTPLLWALSHRDKKMLALLLEFKAPLNAVDQAGKTPLHYAAQFGDLEMVQMLLHAEANVNIADFDGRTPIHYAVTRGNLETVQLLLKAKADVTLAGADGATPLFLAEQAENKAVADLLRQEAPATGRSGVPPAVPSRETMHAIAERVCAGDAAAFMELTNQMNAMITTNRQGDAMRKFYADRWQAAGTVLGAEAGRNNTNAMLALKSFLADRKLKYFALTPLGEAAATGNPDALDILLHGHQHYGFLVNSICFAMGPAAQSNQPPAVAYFVNLARDPETPKNYFYGVGWMIKQVLESASTNGSPEARQALDDFLAVYKQ